MNDEPDSAPRTPAGVTRRLTFWIVLALVGSLVVSGLMIAGANSRIAQDALDQQIAAAREGGQPVAFADLDPRRQGHSFADGRRLARLLQRLKPLPPRLLEQVDRQLKSGQSEDTAELEALLAPNRPTLAEAVELVRGRPIYFERDYAANCPIEVLLPEISPLRDAVRLERADFLLALERRDFARAAEITGEQLDFSEALANDPFLISYLVRVVMIDAALDSAARLIERREASPQWRTAFDERLAGLENSLRIGPTVLSEGAMVYSTMQYLRGQRLLARLAVIPQLGLGRSNPLERLRGAVGGGIARQQSNCLEIMAEAAEAIDLPGAAATARVEVLCDAGRIDRNGNFLFAMLMPALGAARTASLRARQQAAQVRLALRIDDYYRRHGRLPQRLDEVLDDALPAIPAAVFSLRPTAYEHDPGGFRLFDPRRASPDDRAVLEIRYQRAAEGSAEQEADQVLGPAGSDGKTTVPDQASSAPARGD